MTAHLLLVTLGPVQDFIAQARRTRDLWYGSHLLSELGRAAARALVGGGAEVFLQEVHEPAFALEEDEAVDRAFIEAVGGSFRGLQVGGQLRLLGLKSGLCRLNGGESRLRHQGLAPPNAHERTKCIA